MPSNQSIIISCCYHHSNDVYPSNKTWVSQHKHKLLVKAQWQREVGVVRKRNGQQRRRKHNWLGYNLGKDLEV